MTGNIAYKTDAISKYFGTNRRQWFQFYPSERLIIERVAQRRNGSLGRVLDVGCACGGLGAALGQRYDVSSYVGIDINDKAIALAREVIDISVPHRFVLGDIAKEKTLDGIEFETVFNLSCADWNVDFQGILSSSWNRLAPGGTLIISLRLTSGDGVRDINRSFQYIHYGDPICLPAEAERAAYVVLNVSEALGELLRLNPIRITGYGYWGRPPRTARTPFDRLVFSVFAVEKPVTSASAGQTDIELEFPPDIWRARAST